MVLGERPDDALLSDEQVYQLKGGDSIFYSKIVVGILTGELYLILSGRAKEVFRHQIKGSTFLKFNLAFLLGSSVFQYFYLISNGLYDRYHLHQSALYQRLLLNYAFMLENKKKPKIH